MSDNFFFFFFFVYQVADEPYFQVLSGSALGGVQGGPDRAY